MPQSHILYRNVIAAYITCCLFGASIASAQDSTATAKKYNSLKKGAWALQFELNEQFGNLPELDDWLGSTVSLKKHISDRTAYRIGLTLYVRTNTSDISEIRDTLAVEPSDRLQQSYDIKLTVQRVSHLGQDKKITAFWGIGPTIEYVKNKSQTNEVYYNGYRRIQLHDQSSFGVGLSGAIGVEWFVRHNISLMGEYMTTAVYSWGDTNDETRYVNAPSEQLRIRKAEEDGFRISPSSVRLGASVYF